MSKYQSISISKRMGELAKTAADKYGYRSLAEFTENALRREIDRLKGEISKERAKKFAEKKDELKFRQERGEISEKKYLREMAELAEKHFPSEPRIKLPTSGEEELVEEDAKGNLGDGLDLVPDESSGTLAEEEKVPGIDFNEFIRDKLPNELKETLEAHVASCPNCPDLWSALRNFALHWQLFHMRGAEAVAKDDFYDEVIEGSLWPLPKCIYCLLADFVVEKGVLKELWKDKEGEDYYWGVGTALSIILLETGIALNRNPDILEFAFRENKRSKCSLLTLLSGGQALASFFSDLIDEFGDLESEKVERELEERPEEFLEKLGDKMREYKVPADLISNLEDFCDGPVNLRLDEIKTRERGNVSSASKEKGNKDQ